MNDIFEIDTYSMRFEKNSSQYISVKKFLYIERIKEIIGIIIGYCKKKYRFEILEYIQQCKIFENQKIRNSFMQEILQSAEKSMFFSAIQKYINVNGILVENYKGFP